jgi:hypothetical protein
LEGEAGEKVEESQEPQEFQEHKERQEHQESKEHQERLEGQEHQERLELLRGQEGKEGQGQGSPSQETSEEQYPLDLEQILLDTHLGNWVAYSKACAGRRRSTGKAHAEAEEEEEVEEAESNCKREGRGAENRRED